MSYTVNIENSCGQIIVSKRLVVPVSSKFEVLSDAREVILDQIEELRSYDFQFVYKKIKLTKFQEQKQKVQRHLNNGALNIAFPMQIFNVTINLNGGFFGTILFDTNFKISELRKLINSKFDALTQFTFLKKMIPLTEFQEGIYSVYHILDDEIVYLFSDGYQPNKYSTSSSESYKEMICISDDEELSGSKQDPEFTSKIQPYTHTEIAESSGFEKDRKIYFNNFILRNKEYLLSKELSTNSTTVYGIIDTAWCKVKTKLLLNHFAKYENELHHIEKLIDKMNLTEFAISNTYRQVREKTTQNSLKKIITLEKELNENLSKLKTCQANIEKAFEVHRKQKEKIKVFPKDRCQLLEEEEIESLVEEINLDYA